MFVDPNTALVDTTGAEVYLDGLIQFGPAVLTGTTRVILASGDDVCPMLQVGSRVKFGPDAPEMMLDGARRYRLDERQKIIEERVIFFISPARGRLRRREAINW